jgi:hypothetical protein
MTNIKILDSHVTVNRHHHSSSHRTALIADMPPANKATSPTDAAAKFSRPTLSRAVDHAPVTPLYKSTTSILVKSSSLSAESQLRKQSIEGHSETQNQAQKIQVKQPIHTFTQVICGTAPNVIKLHTCIYTPREQGHVASRCGCKIPAPHAELSRRPRALRTRHTKCGARHHHHHHERSSYWQQPAHAAWVA